MPFDPTVAIIFGTLLTALLSSLLYAVWYQQFKHKNKASQSGAQDPSRSIGVSELEQLIHAAVSEAIRPLNARLGVLEEEVQALGAPLGEEAERALVERQEKPLLDMPEDEVAEDPLRLASRKRVR